MVIDVSLKELSITDETTTLSSTTNNFSSLETNLVEGFIQNNNKFYRYNKRREFDNKQQDDSNGKRIKLNSAGEQFSLAFALAWKRFASLE